MNSQRLTCNKGREQLSKRDTTSVAGIICIEHVTAKQGSWLFFFFCARKKQTSQTPSVAQATTVSVAFQPMMSVEVRPNTTQRRTMLRAQRYDGDVGLGNDATITQHNVTKTLRKGETIGI